MSATQKGTSLKVGFGGYTYTSYVPEDATVTYPDGNVEILKDADGATMTKIFMDPATKLDITVIVESAAGSIDPPTDGEYVTLTPPTGSETIFMSMGSTAKHTAGATRLSLSLIKETSMTNT